MTTTIWTKEQVKKTFLDYFGNYQQHVIVPQSLLIPPNGDKSIFFTNSGMNQFKPIFLGQKAPDHLMVCNTQKCIRAGGKHNDFDDVGKDTYHHTMFEMMGNWSFNYDETNEQNYYKSKAINFAWDLLTRIYGLDKSRLYVTYFAGNEFVPADLESKAIWEGHIESSRILPFDRENFWEMAEYGPCGPCTEIHYDLIGNRDASSLVNQDDPTVIEIWNLVFMQFNKVLHDGKTIFEDLPFKHVDTGMGFERLCCVLQGKMSNYDTDIFQPIFDQIYAITKIKPDTSTETQMSYRIIADHIRTLIYAINDDIVPDSVGRGFILRKLFNRALHHACQYLGASDSFMTSLSEKVIGIFIEEEPTIESKKNSILYIINAEEQISNKIIWRSVTNFKKLIDRGDKKITSEDVAVLHQSRGVKLEIIEQFAKDNGFVLDCDLSKFSKKK